MTGLIRTGHARVAWVCTRRRGRDAEEGDVALRMQSSAGLVFLIHLPWDPSSTCEQSNWHWDRVVGRPDKGSGRGVLVSDDIAAGPGKVA